MNPARHGDGGASKSDMTDLMTDPDKGPDTEHHDVSANEARSRQRGIGRRLRQMYDDVLDEDVPDDFRSLLEKIDDRKTASKS